MFTFLSNFKSVPHSIHLVYLLQLQLMSCIVQYEQPINAENLQLYTFLIRLVCLLKYSREHILLSDDFLMHTAR